MPTPIDLRIGLPLASLLVLTACTSGSDPAPLLLSQAITSQTPPDGFLFADPRSSIKIEFAVDFDPESLLPDGSFILNGPNGRVPGTRLIDDVTKRMIGFAPSQSLTHDNSWEVQLNGAHTDEGQAITNLRWNFETRIGQWTGNQARSYPSSSKLEGIGIDIASSDLRTGIATASLLSYRILNTPTVTLRLYANRVTDSSSEWTEEPPLPLQSREWTQTDLAMGPAGHTRVTTVDASGLFQTLFRAPGETEWTDDSPVNTYPPVRDLQCEILPTGETLAVWMSPFQDAAVLRYQDSLSWNTEHVVARNANQIKIATNSSGQSVIAARAGDQIHVLRHSKLKGLHDAQAITATSGQLLDVAISTQGEAWIANTLLDVTGTGFPFVAVHRIMAGSTGLKTDLIRTDWIEEEARIGVNQDGAAALIRSTSRRVAVHIYDPINEVWDGGKDLIWQHGPQGDIDIKVDAGSNITIMWTEPGPSGPATRLQRYTRSLGWQASSLRDWTQGALTTDPTGRVHAAGWLQDGLGIRINRIWYR